MLDNNFINWLMENKRMGFRSARDVVSRCRRIEKVFNITLHTEVKELEDIKKIVVRVKQEFIHVMSSETKTIYAIAVLARAIRLYGEYRDFK